MMRFEFEWLDAPEEGDVLEARTMARLAWSVGDHVITRVYDRATRSERHGIHVPLFPLAQWLVSHWWALLYEPWPFESFIPQPGEVIGEDVRAWIHRHCVRTATPGFAAPFTCIYSEGRTVDVVSRADPAGRYASTPVEFVGSSGAAGEREMCRGALADLVAGVLARLEGATDARLVALAADWRTICSLSPQETEFCRAAGRLGLDPFDVAGWPAELRGWFEQAGDGVLDSDFMTDLLEAPDPATRKPEQHAALERIVCQHMVVAARQAYLQGSASTAFQEGYDAAGSLRVKLGLAEDMALDDLRDASEAACGRSLLQEHATLPEGRVLAVAGWRSQGDPIVITRSTGAPARRFLAARALHLTLRGAARGPRLVTDARTWEQRASRAFGAELLAPRAGVATLFNDAVRRFGREEAGLFVAAHYRVSPMVIGHQLSNQRTGAEGWG